MPRTFVIAFLALAAFVGTAAAQTTTPAPSPNEGAFDKLPPGNQQIAQALFDAQSKNSTTKPLSRDDIAAMKQHRGWGEIFKEMQKNGQIPPDVKNLGQLVSRANHQAHSGTSAGGTTITSGSGKSQVVDNRGKPEFAGKSGKGRFDDDTPASGQGHSYRDNSGRGSFSSGPGGPGNSGHGGGRGK